MSEKNKNSKVKGKSDALQGEFAEEIFDEKSKIGYAPITGGIITRGLVQIGEEILASQSKVDE